MEITEKDLEDLIFDDLASQSCDLDDSGFDIPLTNYVHFRNKVYWNRQVSLKGYGIADIIGFSRSYGILHVEVMELKNRPLKSEDFDQVLRYRQAVKSIIKNSFKGLSFDIHCTLVGPSIESGHYIHNMIYNLSVIEFRFTIKGFEFNTHHEGRWVNTGSDGIHVKDVKRSNEVIVPGFRSVKIAKDNGEKIY